MRLLFTLLVTFQLHLVFSQNEQLPQKVRTDFCKNAYINYKYGSDAFKAWMMQSARNIGLNSLVDIQTAIEKICTNKELQDEFFKTVYRIGGNRDFIFSQFINIDMTAENAKILTDYLIAIYGVDVPEKTSESYINDSSIVGEIQLLKSLYPNGKIQADKSVIYQQTTIGAENNQATYNTKVMKQFLYETNSNNIENNNTAMLAVVLSSAIIKHNEEKTTPFYSVVLLKKIDDNWKSYQTYSHLDLNEINVSSIKCKNEDDKNYLLFIDSINTNTTKAKYYDLQDMYATARVVETTQKTEIEANTANNGKDKNQPLNTTKCRVYKPTFLFDKGNINSKKIHQLSKGLIVYVYLNSYEEMPGKFVRCVYYDAAGKEHIGYVLTAQLQWLQAG